jgi:YD repeat-containing protein
VYDSAGRIAFAIDAEDGVTRFSYDNRGQGHEDGRICREARDGRAFPLATMTSWAAGQDANGANRVTRHYYSARGELRLTVDAEGFVRRTDFDAAGRVTREVRWDSAISVNDSGRSTPSTPRGRHLGRHALRLRFRRRPHRRLERREQLDPLRLLRRTASSPRRSVVESDPSWTYYTYDGAGRVVEEIEANGTAEQARTVYAYDGHGNVVSVTDPNNNVITRTYDRLGRAALADDPLGKVTYSYQYNAFGEAMKQTDARGNSTYIITIGSAG